MTPDIVTQIQRFDPIDGDAREFDSLLRNLFDTLPKKQSAMILLTLLEDHPDEDGTPYWGIVHGLEANGGYEDLLRDSILSRPSFFGVLLANRMLNANEGSEWIPDAFLSIAKSDQTTQRVKDIVEKFIARIPK